MAGIYYAVSYNFSPRQIPGLKLWLDGQDPSGNGTFPTNGAAFNTWVDKSGTGNTTTTGGSDPIYSVGAVTNSGKTRNALSFVAASLQLLNCGITGFPSGSGARTMIAVGQSTNVLTQMAFLGYGAPVAHEGFTIEISSGSTIQLDIQTAGITGNTTLVNNTLYVLTLNYPAGQTSGSVTGNVNGINQTMTANANVPATVNSVGYVGQDVIASSHLNGFVCELLLYNVALSATDQANIITYLRQKYGV